MSQTGLVNPANQAAPANLVNRAPQAVISRVNLVSQASLDNQGSRTAQLNPVSRVNLVSQVAQANLGSRGNQTAPAKQVARASLDNPANRAAQVSQAQVSQASQTGLVKRVSPANQAQVSQAAPTKRAPQVEAKRAPLATPRRRKVTKKVIKGIAATGMPISQTRPARQPVPRPRNAESRSTWLFTSAWLGVEPA